MPNTPTPSAGPEDLLKLQQKRLDALDGKQDARINVDQQKADAYSKTFIEKVDKLLTLVGNTDEKTRETGRIGIQSLVAFCGEIPDTKEEAKVAMVDVQKRFDRRIDGLIVLIENGLLNQDKIDGMEAFDLAQRSLPENTVCTLQTRVVSDMYPKGVFLVSVQGKEQAEDVALGDTVTMLYDVAAKQFLIGQPQKPLASPREIKAALTEELSALRERLRKESFLKVSAEAGMSESAAQNAYKYYAKLEAAGNPVMPVAEIAARVTVFVAEEKGLTEAKVQFMSKSARFFGMLVSGNTEKADALLETARATKALSSVEAAPVQERMKVRTVPANQVDAQVKNIYDARKAHVKAEGRIVLALEKELDGDALLVKELKLQSAINARLLEKHKELEVEEKFATFARLEEVKQQVARRTKNPEKPTNQESYDIFSSQIPACEAFIVYLGAEIAAMDALNPEFDNALAPQKQKLEQQMQNTRKMLKDISNARTTSGAALHEDGVKGHESEFGDFKKLRVEQIGDRQKFERERFAEVKDWLNDAELIEKYKKNDTPDAQEFNRRRALAAMAAKVKPGYLDQMNPTEEKIMKMAEEYSTYVAKLETDQLQEKADGQAILGKANRLRKNIGDYLQGDSDKAAGTKNWVTDDIKGLYNQTGRGGEGSRLLHSLASPDFKNKLLPFLEQYDARLQVVIQRSIGEHPHIKKMQQAANRINEKMTDMMKVIQETQEFARLAEKELNGETLSDQEQGKKQSLEKSNSLLMDRYMGPELLDKLKGNFNDPVFKKDVAYIKAHIGELQAAMRPTLHVGDVVSEFETTQQSQAEHFQNMYKFFAGGQLDQIIDSLDKLQANTTWNNVTYWFKTNGVIIATAVVSTVLVMSVVGAPAGAAGYGAMAAMIATNAVVGGLASTVGVEIGKEIVGTYEKGYKSNALRELVGVEEFSSKTWKQVGWDAGRNILVMGAFSAAGQLMSVGISKAAVSNSVTMNALKIPALARGTMHVVEKSGRILGEGSKNTFVRTSSESGQEFIEEGWETLMSQMEFNPSGNEYLDGSGQWLLGSLATMWFGLKGREIDVRVKAGPNIDLAFVNVDTSGKQVDMTYKVDTSRPLIHVSADVVAALKTQFNLDASPPIRVNAQTGEISFDAKTGVDAQGNANITSVVIRPSLEPIGMRNFMLERPKQMADYGVKFDEASGTYTFDPALTAGTDAKVGLADYLRAQGFVVTPDASVPGALHIQSGEVDTKFTPSGTPAAPALKNAA